MEMEMIEGNYSDESTATSHSSGESGGSFSPPLKRFCKAFTDTTTTTADADTDSKTLSTRSSISEEFGGPHLLQPSDPVQQTVFVGKRRCTTIEDYCSNKFSWEECKDFLRSLRPQPESQPESEIWRVDPDLLACYARQALEYFKEATGEHYFYAGPRSMCLCSLPDSEYKMTHINFFARPPGEMSQSLFFAALELSSVRKVVECCSVMPMFKDDDGVVPCIKHPRDVDCSECVKFGDSALCFEAEEEYSGISWSDAHHLAHQLA